MPSSTSHAEFTEQVNSACVMTIEDYPLNKIALFMIWALSVSLLPAQTTQDVFWRGADISFTPQIESLGGKFKLNGVERDLLDILRENGVNYIRLRLWHTPTNGWCGLQQTVTYAQRIKAKGLKFLLDFHYSDWWADPGKQNKPAAWASASYSALKESVYTYSKYVLETLKKNNALPEMVQIGNEITGGMLWPDGRNNTSQGWIQFCELVKEGIRGSRDGAADSTMHIMIHIDRGGDNAGTRWFYDNLIGQGVQFDIIGLSYYPWWHGTLTQMKNNLIDLAGRYNKPIIIAETAYPWTTQSLNDGSNITVDPTKLPKGYPISPQGQKAFLAQVTKIIKETPNKKGIGFFYWEPGYISVPPIGSSWEHLTVFDFTGAALLSVNSFLNLDSLKQITVQLRVNTATLWDTLKSNGVVQLRGEVLGKGSCVLPSGHLVAWDSYTEIVPQNVGGDYWSTQFKMFSGDRLEYKFWGGHTTSIPTNLRLGNEGPVTPSDGSNRNMRLMIAADNDTTLDLQYFNSSGYTVPQFWSPIQKKQDTLGIYFRVNLADLMTKGQFDPAVHGPVAVRGDSSASAGLLSWFSDRVILQRETLSVGGGSFWSGTVYFPKNAIVKGAQIPYKFFIANGSFNGWEGGIANRILNFPAGDSTLSWKFFNERYPVTEIHRNSPDVPDRIQLYPNYPNPFNSSTTFRYSLTHSCNVNLSVYNLLGQQVCTLTDISQQAGIYSVQWSGTDEMGNPLASGIYVAKLSAGGFSQFRTMVMIK